MPSLDADHLRRALGPRWQRVEVVERTGSTNADLLADRGAPDRSALVAEHQTAGRGRLDRTWTSPPGTGLTFSALLRPPVPLARWGWLPLLAGLALHEAVRDVTGVATALKWPNDLLTAGSERKLAGILAQTADDAVVIGIGLNVSTPADQLPVDTASSLVIEGAQDVDRAALLAAVLTAIDMRCAQWADCGGDAAACGLEAAYSEACVTFGRAVRVSLTAQDPIEGEAVGLDELGRLRVRTAAGEEKVGAGDVEHLRTADG
jgi:BirA family biotin operon repressor/biotin-[acetyl-CoA-carboxylase] ligase